MAKIEVTLTRAHKIAERLKDRATQLFQESLTLSRSTHHQRKPTPAQIQRVQDDAARCLTASALAERYTHAAASVRAVIARENQARGINAMLGNLDALNRMLKHYKELLLQAEQDGVRPSELAELDMASEETRYGVQVTPLEATAREMLEEKVAQFQREAYRTSDRIAEANAHFVTLEMDDDLAHEVTG